MKKSRKRSRRWYAAGLAGCLLLSGASACLGQAPDKPVPEPAFAAPPEALPAPAPATNPPASFVTEEIFSPAVQVMRIDLPTALRIADTGNPTINLARARVEEAYARVEQAQLMWLPNLQAGAGYLRHDGEIQNAAGVVFQTSKSNASSLGGAVLELNTNDALFGPLVARRLAEAQAASSRAVNNNVQLDVALAYLELLRTYAQLAVNADLLARDQEVLRRTREGNRVQLLKTGADLNRAETEVQLRLQERILIKGQVRVASSRLARLLLLEPTVALLPAEPTVVPVALVPEDASADELIGVGLMNRPELSESRSLVAASETRLRQAKLMPLMPHIEVYYQAGVFGGGQDDRMSNFNGRGDGGASALWELRNFGLGNMALNKVRRTEVREADYHVLEVQAQVSDEVNSAIQIARARREALTSSQEAVRQAVEMFRKLDEIAFGMTGPKKELETVEPILALQALAQARLQYLNAVVEYNRAQFQLYTAIGRPTADALPKACATPVNISTVPPPYLPPKPQ